MSTRSNIVLGVAGLLFAALPVVAKTPKKAEPKATAVQTAVIENTGSTNTSGYTITLTSTGGKYHVASVSNNGNDRNSETGNKEPLGQQVRQFFADLSAAMPLTDLPAGRGMRSASFGTRTFITYQGQRSPDLTFSGDPRTAALKADIAVIATAMRCHNSPRRPAMPQPVTPSPAVPTH